MIRYFTVKICIRLYIVKENICDFFIVSLKKNRYDLIEKILITMRFEKFTVFNNNFFY